MKYGLHLAGGASVCDRATLREVAMAAEEEGYDCILIGDHIVLPKTITTPGRMKSITTANPTTISTPRWSGSTRLIRSPLWPG